MTIRWSSLHRVLGELPGPLTLDHVQRAVDQKVAEVTDLDWKAVLPDRVEAIKDELCKDIAAMANSGGGLIVFGVAEKSKTGQAERIEPVSLAEPPQRQIRSLAAARIEPGVAGLQFLTLPVGDDGGTEGVLVLQVPRSPGTPHMLNRQGELRVPYREGPETLWMNESQLERAYADRFARRRDEHQVLASMITDVADQLDYSRGAWIVGVARPRIPAPAVAGAPTREDASTLLRATLSRAVEVLPENGRFRYLIIRELESAALNPRIGLKRWVSQTPYGGSPDDRSNAVYVALHHDGGVAFASIVDWTRSDDTSDRHKIPVAIVESFIIDFVTLVDVSARHRLVDGSMAARIDLLRDDELPLAAFTHEIWGGGFIGPESQPHWSRTVRRFVPVEADLSAPANDDALRESAAELARDVLHQFGIEELLNL